IVDGKLKLGNWTFLYLGTQPETWDDAGAIGLGAGSISTYQSARAGEAYAFTSAALHRLARSVKLGSRTLFQDHAKVADAAAAGMKVNPDAASAKPRQFRHLKLLAVTGGTPRGLPPQQGELGSHIRSSTVNASHGTRLLLPLKVLNS